MKRLCPKCGKEIDSDNSINNFCIDCYLKEHDIIHIPKIEMSICPKCNKIKYARKFYDNIEDLERDISKHIKIKDLSQVKVRSKLDLDFENNKYFLTVSVRCLIGNKIRNITKIEKIIVKKELCVICSRLSGSYYTTILQIRFEDKKNKRLLEDKIINEIKKEIDIINKKGKKENSIIHIVKETKQKTGIDFYFDNSLMTTRIVQHLTKHKSTYLPKHSKTLVGIDKNGQRKYRHTVCVKFGKKD